MAEQAPERDEHGRRARVSPPPPNHWLDAYAATLRPARWLTQPYVTGLDDVPPGGVLFAGNHSSFAVLDFPVMFAEMWQRRRIQVRPIADHGHYLVPGWRELLESVGIIRGTRANVRQLMREGADLLVFPGGAAEVFRPRGHKYELWWKNRLGFTKLAIEFGYPIVPFAAVGAEEMFDIVVDESTPGFTRLSSAVKAVGGWGLPPLPAGIGPTLVPRFQRLYFSFGPAIDTTRFGGDASDEHARQARDEVHDAVVDGLAEMRRVQALDPRRSVGRRLTGWRQEPVSATASARAGMLAQRAIDAWNHLRDDAFPALLDPRVQLFDPPRLPDATSWHRREGVVAQLSHLAEQAGVTRVELIDASAPQRTEIVATLRLLRGTVALPSVRVSARLADDRIVALRLLGR